MILGLPIVYPILNIFPFWVINIFANVYDGRLLDDILGRISVILPLIPILVCKFLFRVNIRILPKLYKSQVIPVLVSSIWSTWLYP